MIGFLRQTRGGSTAIAAATVAVMIAMAMAFISDHLWLVSKRDLLKGTSKFDPFGKRLFV